MKKMTDRQVWKVQKGMTIVLKSLKEKPFPEEFGDISLQGTP